MKLLFVINSMGTGGAEKIITDLIPALHQEGVEITLLLLDGTKTPFLEKLQKQRVCTIKSLGHGNIYNPFLIFRIIPYLKKADVVHVHLFPCLYWVALAKIFAFVKVPMIFTEHSTYNRRRKSWFLKLTDTFVYRRYNVIVTISTEVKLYLKKHLKFQNTAFKTIQNGVDISVFSDAVPLEKSSISIPSENKVLVMIARFSAEKDHETLLKAIPFIEQPTTLLLIGDGPKKEKLQELTQLLEIEDKVLFMGIREDIPNILKTADIAILSSHHEGLSLSGIEAMAAGIPLVASKVAGLVGLAHGAGVLFEHKDYLDLAKKINKLLSDHDWYVQKAASCLHRSTKFSLQKMVSEHLKLYTEVCPEKS